MHYIAERAPPGLSATAQGLYSALSGGLVMGLMMLLAGLLFEHFGAAAYLAMTFSSLAGAALALGLARRASALP